jgi:NAD(P)-dependent dehydrogenase (short-subunit alcohol dehydrogenase family)
MKRIGVVSGANRGIGLEISRELARRGVHVVLTSRDEAKGRAGTEKLQGEQLDVEYHPLDVTRADSIRALAEHLKKACGGLDILVNNAGVSFSGFNAEVARATLEVNFFGPLQLTDALLPLMRQGGRIVMVTSGLGDRSSLSGVLEERFLHPAMLSRDELVELMRQFIADVAAGKHAQAGWPSSAYRVSKIGLNVLTAQIAKELEPDERRILCNAACPGWVRTDMGGSGASRSIEEGAETPVWLALLPEGGPQGGVFRDKAPARW